MRVAPPPHAVHQQQLYGEAPGWLNDARAAQLAGWTCPLGEPQKRQAAMLNLPGEEDGRAVALHEPG